MHVAQECLANVSPEQFWSIADNYPDLVKCLHVQTRLAGNFGLNGGVPWLLNTEGALCFICKENVENVNHFLSECREFRNNFDSIWLNLRQKIASASPIDGPQIFDFIHHLNQRHKVLLLLGGLQLPFDRESVTLITWFICSLSIRCSTSEKRNCVSWRHHGSLNKSFFFSAMYACIIFIIF